MIKNYVLVINCGSSSVKFAVYNLKDNTHKGHGLVDNINTDSCHISYSYNNNIHGEHIPNVTIREALNKIISIVKDDANLIKNLAAIGHRVVHGGPKFNESIVINDNVINELENTINLAPLHNPSNLAGIKACMEAFPKIKNVAVFDTGFHANMPLVSSTYAISKDLADKYHIRRYGFHGISHNYIYNRMKSKISKKSINIISAHLGNGASICAIKNGVSVDTSMGFTPLAGLVMGTRSGDVDPGLHQYLASSLKISITEVTDLLNTKSGLRAISGISHDMRKLEEEYLLNNPSAKLAIDIFCYSAAKYIASYMVAVKHADAIVFTGGIGENSPLIRKLVLEQLDFLHIKLSNDLNKHNGDIDEKITQATSSIPVFVIKTDEELLIAQLAIKGEL